MLKNTVSIGNFDVEKYHQKDENEHNPKMFERSSVRASDLPSRFNF